jgi:CubicO group peptidase (beta-lactamase class C family)
VCLVIGSTLVLLLVAGATWARSSPDSALFVARDIAWGPSDVWEYQKFPERVVNNATPAFQFKQNLKPELFQNMTIEYKQDGQAEQANFGEFLKSTQTTSFIVIKDDTILYEGYFNGYTRDSIVTSFSMAKSVTSALIGIAIDEGYIENVDDPIIYYLPELRGKGLDEVTIWHLLLMSSGIRYISDDEISGLAQLSPFADDALSYSYPDLRSQALTVPPDGKQPGTEFNYNNYNPPLLGMILERTTHMSVATYLQEKIWKPLGMEYPASWSLDSKESGMEETLCCINARAIDFAKFGVLFLHNGNWNGKQIISEQWVKESTSPYPTNPNGDIAWRANTWFSDWPKSGGYYKYQWWGRINPDGSYDFMAWGHLGQRIYVSPQNHTVVVRHGISDKGVDSWDDVLESVVAKVK